MALLFDGRLGKQAFDRLSCSLKVGGLLLSRLIFGLDVSAYGSISDYAVLLTFSFLTI